MVPRKAIRLAFAILAIAFFATPIAARVAGVTAESFENRRLAAAPKLSQGWDAFPQTTQFLTDRMPLRKQAIQANTRIWTDVFDTDPLYGSPRSAPEGALPFATVADEPAVQRRRGLQGPVTARTGRAGWLFIDAELEYACDTATSIEDVLERWGRVVKAVRDEGRRSALFVVPEKASVYPEHLPDEYLNDHCALAGKDRLWRHLARAGREVGVIELRSRLLDLKRQVGDALFQREDLHWTTLGALVLVETILEELGGEVRLRRDEIVARGAVRYRGDLGLAAGDPAAGRTAEYDIEREPNARRVPGKTVIVCDSFAYKWMRLLEPYFADIRYVSIYHDEREIAAAIREADTVIFEAEEVNLRVQAARGGTALRLVDLLRARSAKIGADAGLDPRS